MYNNTAIAHHVVPHFLLSKNKALLSEYLQNLWLVNPKFARKQIQYTAMLNVVPNVVSNVVPFVVPICCTHLLCAPCLFSTILTLDYLPKKQTSRSFDISGGILRQTSQPIDISKLLYNSYTVQIFAIHLKYDKVVFYTEYPVQEPFNLQQSYVQHVRVFASKLVQVVRPSWVDIVFISCTMI